MFRLEARILSKRGSGDGDRSLTGALAYRLGVQLGEHDYSRKSVDAVGAIGAPGADGWCRDPARFAAAVDRMERRRDAQLGREIVLTIDRRIPPGARALLVEAWSRTALPPGVAGFYAIHSPRALDGDENPHAHVVFSNRRVGTTPDELGPKIRQSVAENAAELERWRATWALLQNRLLERAGRRGDLTHRRRVSQDPREPKMGRALHAVRRSSLSQGPSPARERVESVLALRRARQAAREAPPAPHAAVDQARRAEHAQRLLQASQRPSRAAAQVTNSEALRASERDQRGT